RAGMAEAVKVALTKDKEFFLWFEENASRLAAFDPSCLETRIKRCAELHATHIMSSGDPFERGSSRPLDFGHWLAHKLEILSDYQIRHGEAVAVGMAVDTYYSYLKGFLDSAS